MTGDILIPAKTPKAFYGNSGLADTKAECAGTQVPAKLSKPS